ncbi:MAG: carbohydrate-binding domain-containing protein [Candidatus Binatia bacterium]
MIRKRIRRFTWLLGLAVLTPTCACSNWEPTGESLVPAQMSRTAGMASADGAVTFWENGSLESKVRLDKGPVAITVRALGNRVDGESPALLVDLDGRKVGRLVIDTQGEPKDFSLKAEALNTGTELLRLSFDNYVAKEVPLQSRWLVVQRVSIDQGAEGGTSP